jgi:hypothetical protein
MEAEARRKDMVHNMLLKAEIEVRKTYPRASGAQTLQLQEQSEAKAEQKRKEAELQAKHQQEFENPPMQVYVRDVARDPDFYSSWRRPAPACMQREFLEIRDKKALEAARAVWLERFDCQLPEVMAHYQCNQALRMEYELLK